MSNILALDDIFRICRKKYPEGVARVASVALYWAQFAHHHFHGKLGFYETDADLGKAIGRHGKTAGTNLLKVCTPLGQNNATALFEVSYGPKAGQDGGRCRWLFLTPQGEQIIKAALEDRMAREDAKRGRRVRRGGLPFRTGRGGGFDSAVKELAPSIAKFQSAGCRDIRKLAKQLNDAGLTAPSGRPFSYSTLRRVLIRQAELHLGQGPRTVSTAASQRPSRPFRFRPAKPMRLSPSAREEFRRFQEYRRGGE
jgi:hypothetical protein